MDNIPAMVVVMGAIVVMGALPTLVDRMVYGQVRWWRASERRVVSCSVVVCSRLLLVAAPTQPHQDGVLACCARLSHRASHWPAYRLILLTSCCALWRTSSV